MKFLLQILLFFFTFFLQCATTVYAKIVLPYYELSFSKTEIVKEESIVKIGEQNFARSSIENKSQFSSISKGKVWGRYDLQGESDVLFKNLTWKSN
ncbi:hypothetical protein [Tenacibaculum sp. UWU-22]|uniref:hypothetical protein n=1 Tax=Tenacibaculum sp. UWU-22 TaxID=3234187 RepID=UPI0034DADD1A